jgi:hypothetical protein
VVGQPAGLAEVPKTVLNHKMDMNKTLVKIGFLCIPFLECGIMCMHFDYCQVF